MEVVLVIYVIVSFSLINGYLSVGLEKKTLALQIFSLILCTSSFLELRINTYPLNNEIIMEKLSKTDLSCIINLFFSICSRIKHA